MATFSMGETSPVALMALPVSHRPDWVLDTGTTNRLYHDRSAIEEYRPVPNFPAFKVLAISFVPS